jgi:copper chaperone
MIPNEIPLRGKHESGVEGGALSSSTYTVIGMTCGHCVESVKEEVGQVAGVTGVDVDLATGRLTVTGDGPVDEARVRGAVAEAGYEIAPR